jgi:SAM-dependent methyltransferase
VPEWSPHGIRVAELGPGLSLGVGVASVLSGGSFYAGLDASRDASPARDATIATDIAGVLMRAADDPCGEQFPEVLPVQRSVSPRVNVALDEGEIQRRLPHVSGLLQALASRTSATEDGLTMEYLAPPLAERAAQPSRPCDLVVAQAVLEHVEDVPSLYAQVAQWLAPGGLFTFTIDFRSHGLTRAWNGHWAFSSDTWQVVRGRRNWGLNRLSLSSHLALLDAAGFEVLRVERQVRTNGIGRPSLAREFSGLSPADLETSSAYVLARRPRA